MGLFGGPNIEKLKASRDVGGLTKALSYTGGDLGKARDTRVAAATALAELRDPQALAGLTAVALRDPEGADGGRRRGDEPDRIPPPQDALVRATAQAIAAIDPGGVDALVSALREDHGREARSRAALALGELRHAPVLNDIVAMRVAVEDKIRSMKHWDAILEHWHQFRSILNWSIERIDPAASTPRPAVDPHTGEPKCAICGSTDSAMRPFLVDKRYDDIKLIRICSDCGEAFCANHVTFTNMEPWPSARCPGCGKILPVEPAGTPAPATAAPVPTAPLAPQPAGSLDTEANELIQQALAIIDDHVHIEPGALQVSGAGSEGPVAMAAATLEKAHARHASSPLLHYAYCSALAIAAQHKTARDQMELLNKAHPEYPLARWALASWDRWKSLFTVPHWAPDSRALPTALAQAVITCTLLPVRDGIEPRTALFFRDRNGDFQDLAALQAARIDITAVIDETDARAPVIGIYAQVWDDPSNALGVEAHGLAWYPRGHSIRRSYEHLCTQDDLDFVVIGANDAVLLNRRLPMPDRMKTSLSELRRLLDSDNAYEYQPNEVQTAVAAHQQRYSAGSVAY